MVSNASQIVQAALEQGEEGLWDTLGTPAYSVTIGGEQFTVVPSSDGEREWWSITRVSTGESTTVDR